MPRAEQIPLSLPQLKEEQTRISGVVTQRQKRFDGVGELVEPRNSLKRDLRIAQVRDRLSVLIDRDTTSLGEINDQLAFLVPAQEYLDQVALTKQQLTELKELAGSDPVFQKSIEKHETEFRTLAGRPGREPQLRRAIELLNQQEAAKEPEPTPEAIKPTIGIDFSSGNAWINGHPLNRLTHEEKVVLLRIAKNAGSDVSLKDLKRVLQEEKLNDAPGNPIRNIRSAIEQLRLEDIDPYFVIATPREDGDPNSRYRMNAIVVPVDKEGKPIEPIELHGHIPEEILSKLSPSERGAVAALPFLSELPLPLGFGVTLESPVKALHPDLIHVIPSNREWLTTKKYLSDARRRLADDHYAIESYRPPGKAQNNFFTTTADLATKLWEQRRAVRKNAKRAKRGTKPLLKIVPAI